MLAVLQISKVALAGLGALLLCAVLSGALEAYQAASASSSVFSPWASAKLVFLYTFVFGTLPILLFGAPLYVALHRRGKTNWPVVVALGVLPGVALLGFALGLGLWAILVGAIVAAMTHIICRARL